MKDHDEPPATIKEVGIHIGYMRNDISELKDLVKSMPSAFASKEELHDVKYVLEGKIVDVGDRVTIIEAHEPAKQFVTRKEVYAIVGGIGLVATVLAIIVSVTVLIKNNTGV